MSTRDAVWRLMSVYPWQPCLTSPQGFRTHPHTHWRGWGISNCILLYKEYRNLKLCALYKETLLWSASEFSQWLRIAIPDGSSPIGFANCKIKCVFNRTFVDCLISRNFFWKFYVLLAVHLSIILDNGQLDANLRYLEYVYYNPLHVSSIICSS